VAGKADWGARSTAWLAWPTNELFRSASSPLGGSVVGRGLRDVLGRGVTEHLLVKSSEDRTFLYSNAGLLPRQA